MTDAATQAHDHLWMHFTRMSSYDDHPVPVIVRGEGAYIYDQRGTRILDGLSGLFVVQAGHGREELAKAAYDQARDLAFFPLWSFAHPAAAELAERLAALAPGDLDRVFFTTGGGEAVESAWKIARQYFKLTGQPGKTKVISRVHRLPRHHHGGALDHRHPGGQGRRSSRSCPARSRCRTRTSTGPPSTATTSRPSGGGRPTRSRRPS